MAFESEKRERPESNIEVTGVIIPIAEGMFSVSEQEVKELKSAVESSDGKIAVFIHPYSERHLPTPEFNSEERAGIESYEKAFETFIRENGSMPLVIMEVDFRVSSTEKLVGALSPSQKIYYLRTRFEEDAGEGGITLAAPSFDYFVGGTKRQGSWEQMRHVFKYLGVKEVTVGGMYLDDSSRAGKPESGPDAYSYCVAQVWRNLDKDFEVAVSPITFPLSGSNVRK
jgi:hypothetical protein